MESPLALYRRYRPETFQEVIGQDHVTEPLRAALAANRVNHAYLFSGPRGCGKTTSARILARALNCAQAPISDPCGECDPAATSRAAARARIDVIEIDAASHGGVDDARDLREKAFFAPVRDRYKVYIIDEAHMVTTQGFNALLKLIEEPPPHLRFIFATTEPDKVLPHHPLAHPPLPLPADPAAAAAATTCPSSPARRAWRSSPPPCRSSCVPAAGRRVTRSPCSTSCSVGAGPGGVTYKVATDLLGFTARLAPRRGRRGVRRRATAPAVFRSSTRSSRPGRTRAASPRTCCAGCATSSSSTAVPDAPATGLIDVPEDAGERLVAQAARFGAIELSRAADIVAAGLTEMRGATAPRLLLELLCARVLLPGADHTADGVMARLERLERRMDVTGAPAPAAGRRSVPTGRPARGAVRRAGRSSAGRAPRRHGPVGAPAGTRGSTIVGVAARTARRRAGPAAADAGGAHGRARLTRPRRRSAAAPADAGRSQQPATPQAPPVVAEPAPAPAAGCRARRAGRPSSPPVLAAASAWSTYAGCGPTSSSRPRTVAAWPGWCSPSTPTWSTSTGSG